MIQFTFKPEFEEKLKGVKEFFLKNVQNDCILNNIDISERLIHLNEKTKFSSFISSSFQWGKTPEGHKFWETVSKR